MNLDDRSRLHKAVEDLTRQTWFPHIPISLALALLGVLHLMPVLDQAQSLQLHLLTPGSIRQDLTGVDLPGVSQLSLGVFLLIMSVGLWLRLQFAWLLAVLGLGLAIVLATLSLQSDRPAGIWQLAYDTLLMGSLLAAHRQFSGGSFQLATLAALVAVLVLFAYTVFGTYYFGAQFSPQIDTLTDALYVSVVTMTTVGFGDFTPTTTDARLFLVSVILLSIALLSTAVGATLIPAMVSRIAQITTGRRVNVLRKNHYIIIGYSALAANTYRELADRQEQVTVILTRKSDSAHFNAEDIDIVVGDGGNLDTLREAGAEQAKAIMALMDDDSENAFVILAVKELQIKAKTVVAVSQAKHLARVRRVHPDMIIAPQVLGGELLTSVLTGERIDVKGIMGRLLGQSDAVQTSDKKKQN
ncbi:MAG: voltage-gated potassium channel [Gammaproteobacteria bacterium]|nr:MAG: voltage-gated potassium channel [Gammaproteobacteria bacterium]